MPAPLAFPPAIAELLALRPVAPLGPGVPVAEVKPKLLALTDSSFGVVKNFEMASACRSALWLAFNFLDESHSISQDLATPEGSYWHALMHRREPDHSNAAYWFRRVGTHPVYAQLKEAAAEVGYAVPGDWDPFAFNRLCEVHASSQGSQQALLLKVQHLEWELLFAWCFEGAVGE